MSSNESQPDEESGQDVPWGLLQLEDNDSEAQSGHIPHRLTNLEASPTSSAPQLISQPPDMDLDGMSFPTEDDGIVDTHPEMQQMGVTYEASATDEAFWLGTLQHEHEDSEMQQVGSGSIEWVMDNFNSRCLGIGEKLKSEPIQAAWLQWHLTFNPRRNASDYLNLFFECKTMKEPHSSGDRSLYESLRAPLPLLWQSDNLRPREIIALVQLLVFNPSEPRVYHSKSFSHTYSVNHSEYGFNHFGPAPLGDLGKIRAGGRVAMLANDTIAFRAYFRLFIHPIPKPRVNSYEHFFQSGLRGLTVHETHQTFKHRNLVAAVALCILLPQSREEIYKIQCPWDRVEPTKMPLPLTAALQDVLIKMRMTPRADKPVVVDLAPVIEAIQWHGLDVQYHISPIKILEILEVLLKKEKKLSEVPIARLGEFRSGEAVHSAQVYEHGPDFLITLRGTSKHIIQQVHSPFNEGDATYFDMHPPLEQFDTERREWRPCDGKGELPKALPVGEVDPTFVLCGVIIRESRGSTTEFTTYVRPNGDHWYVVRDDKITCLPNIDAETQIFTKKDSKPRIILARYVRKEMIQLATASPPESKLEMPYRWLSKNKQDILDVVQNKIVREVVTSRQNLPVEFKVFKSTNLPFNPSWGLLDIFNKDSLHSYMPMTITLPVKETLDGVKFRLAEAFEEIQDPRQCELWAISRNNTNSKYPLFTRLHNGNKLPLNFLIREYPMQYLLLHVIDQSAIQPSSPPIAPPVMHMTNADTFEEEASAIDENDILAHFEDDQDGEIERDDTSISIQSNFAANNVPCDSVYFLLKYFNCSTQSLEPLSSHSCNATQTIGPQLDRIWKEIEERKDLAREYEEFWNGKPPIDYYIENPTGPVTPLNRYATFVEVVTSEMQSQWLVIIVQLRSKPDHESLIASQGGLTDINEILRDVQLTENHLKDSKCNFAQYLSKIGNTKSAVLYDIDDFDEGYYAYVPFPRGKPHGYGSHVARCGNCYIGDFVMGERTGHGHMRFMSGDTYVGGLLKDVPHGSGVYTWAHSGNVYKGTYRMGRRYGSGTMHYKNFDNDQRLCAICFDNEQNCAFSGCWHVCACMDCARQLTVCPICRRMGVTPVRLYFSSAP